MIEFHKIIHVPQKYRLVGNDGISKQQYANDFDTVN